MQTETSAHRAARRRRRGDVGPSRRGRGRPAARRYRRGAGADPRRNGDDYPMTSLSDGLGPQKDPNSGRTRVQSGPAGTHRPTPGRRRPIVSRRRVAAQSAWPRVPGAPRGRVAAQSAWPRVPGDGSGRPAPSARHARRAAGDRGPWVSLPLRATIPEGNTVGQHADGDVGPSSCSSSTPGRRRPIASRRFGSAALLLSP